MLMEAQPLFQTTVVLSGVRVHDVRVVDTHVETA
jgi:hypothetical protein